jgi:hypothetical protein
MNISDKLKEMRGRCEAATPVKWRVEDYRKDGGWRSTRLLWANTEEQYFYPGTCVLQIDCRELHAGSAPEKIAEFEANATFVCEAKKNMPALIEALEVCFKALQREAQRQEKDDGGAFNYLNEAITKVEDILGKDVEK